MTQRNASTRIPGRNSKWPVAVIGATGAVGQSFIRLLADHPWFEVAEVAASERSRGKLYGEAANWLEGELSDGTANLKIVASNPKEIKSQIVFSALDSSAAGPIEEEFARAGKFILSNARNHRLDSDVPLVIPEINPDQFDLIEVQKKNRGWSGAMITNANCAATVAAVALAPLHQKFGIRKVFVTTMQAISGAGYPGVASLDILGNVIPYIAEEEEKIERELLKLLGRVKNGEVKPAPMTVSAQTNRVAVENGHTVCMTIECETKPSPEAAIETLRAWRGASATNGLPSRPEFPVVVTDNIDRPQPRKDVNAGAGMTVTVGRVRSDPILDLRLVAMGHNTIRGAAGGSILNAEYLVSTGAIKAE